METRSEDRVNEGEAEAEADARLLQWRRGPKTA